MLHREIIWYSASSRNSLLSWLAPTYGNAASVIGRCWAGRAWLAAFIARRPVNTWQTPREVAGRRRVPVMKLPLHKSALTRQTGVSPTVRKLYCVASRSTSSIISAEGMWRFYFILYLYSMNDCICPADLISALSSLRIKAYVASVTGLLVWEKMIANLDKDNQWEKASWFFYMHFDC